MLCLFREKDNLTKQNHNMKDKVSELSTTNSHLESQLRERGSVDTITRENVRELNLQSVTAKYDEEKKTRQDYEQKVAHFCPLLTNQMTYSLVSRNTRGPS